MTGTPHSGNGAAPAAVLAVRLDELRREVESLTSKVDTLASTQQEHGTALKTMQELRRQVELILATLDEEDDATPSAWCWLTMTKQQHDEKFAELRDWVETVLRPQYASYVRDHIKRCWANHREARWELAYLYQLWSQAYLANRSAPRDAADWHDRWLQGAIRRLTEVMQACETACRISKG